MLFFSLEALPGKELKGQLTFLPSTSGLAALVLGKTRRVWGRQLPHTPDCPCLGLTEAATRGVAGSPRGVETTASTHRQERPAPTEPTAGAAVPGTAVEGPER